MNVYLRDAGEFLKTSASLINDNIEKREVIQATLNFALGLERILKGILFEVNPTYVLIDPTFNSSLMVLYKRKLILNTEGHSELNKNPNADVITFRYSLLRAQAISETTFNNKNLLFVVSNARDIIAHNDLSLLDIEKLKLLLKRDFYQIIADYCTELSISKGKYFEAHHIRLSELSGKYVEDLDKKLSLILNAQLEKFKMLSQTIGYIEDKNKVTNYILSLKDKFPITCPCCTNRAIIYTKEIKEFNQFENKEITVGLKVMKLKCRYCKLDISDYKLLDHMKLESQIKVDD